MATSKTSKRKNKAAEAAKAGAAGMARATFGRKTSFKNKKKENARRACRGNHGSED